MICNKSILAAVLLSLALSESALGQICGVSEYPYSFAGSNYPRMNGHEFKAISVKLPFVAETERRPRYSQFWINTDVLNVRAGPGFEYEITSETYYGNLVFAYAKTGDWVAIGKGFSYDDIKIKPKWVHINYLSPKRIEAQVDVETLKNKCGFRQYGESNIDRRLHDSRNNLYNACGSVINYLIQQKFLSKSHNYYDEYFHWRSVQKNPENYEVLPCDKWRKP